MVRFVLFCSKAFYFVPFLFCIIARVFCCIPFDFIAFRFAPFRVIFKGSGVPFRSIPFQITTFRFVPFLQKINNVPFLSAPFRFVPYRFVGGRCMGVKRKWVKYIYPKRSSWELLNGVSFDLALSKQIYIYYIFIKFQTVTFRSFQYFFFPVLER